MATIMQSMKTAAPARMAAGRRVAVVRAFAAPAVRSAVPVARSGFQGQRVVADRVAFRVSRSKAVVVEAMKKSVGDLTKADLEGKRVSALSPDAP
jgi:phosphoglycerate kinase